MKKLTLFLLKVKTVVILILKCLLNIYTNKMK